MSIFTLLAVGLGGAIGALCRHKATAHFKPRLRGLFPWHTFCINAIACFIAGCALAATPAMGEIEHLALAMGFLGGFSTLSTMNCEAVDLMVGGHAALGGAYLAATYGGALAMAAAGFFLMGAIL